MMSKNQARFDKETREHLFERVVINKACENDGKDNFVPSQKQAHHQNNSSPTAQLCMCFCAFVNDGSVVCPPGSSDNILQDRQKSVSDFVCDKSKLSAGDTLHALSEVTCKQDTSAWSDSRWCDWMMLQFSAENDELQHQPDDCNSWLGDSEEMRVHDDHAPGRLVKLRMLRRIFGVMDVRCTLKLYSGKWTDGRVYTVKNGARRVEMC